MSDEYFFYLVIGGFLSFLLGLIPAFIASNKGHSFLGYWIFGACLFILALPVAILVAPHSSQRQPVRQTDPIAQLERLTQLRLQGTISEEEFESLKRRALSGEAAFSHQIPEVASEQNRQPTQIILAILAGLVLLIIGLALIL